MTFFALDLKMSLNWFIYKLVLDVMQVLRRYIKKKANVAVKTILLLNLFLNLVTTTVNSVILINEDIESFQSATTDIFGLLNSYCMYEVCV